MKVEFYLVYSLYEFEFCLVYSLFEFEFCLVYSLFEFEFCLVYSLLAYFLWQARSEARNFDDDNTIQQLVRD